MDIKAIIFDMDGVLIDAREWHYEALNHALENFGMEISRYDHLVTFDGLPTKEKLRMLSLETGLPHELHGFINELKQQVTIQLIYTHCRPVFYHEYALSRLKNEGYRLAVCSNSIRNTVDVMMERSALDKYLDFTLSNEDVTRAKPDPEIYTKAIEKLGLEPQQCLVVEDNEKGIEAARGSGAYVLEVDGVEEVNYQNIVRELEHIKKAGGKHA
jgi:HAD superfamily hydrolase (TIGR01509 family)